MGELYQDFWATSLGYWLGGLIPLALIMWFAWYVSEKNEY